MIAVFFPTVHAVCAGSSVARQWNEEILAAIRLSVPNPPAHARNLHHLATAVYDAWAAYDTQAVGYLYNEKMSPLPANVAAARDEAISYAAYRVLRARYVTPIPSPANYITIANRLNARMTALGYSVSVAKAATTNAKVPSELGKRIADAILAWGNRDGYSLTKYPQEYTVAVNPNVAAALAMSVMGNNGESPTKANMPLGVGIPLIANTEQAYTQDTDPNFWQPLSLSVRVTQNGIPTPGVRQTFLGVQSLATTPFALSRQDPLKPWIDPGGPPRLSTPGHPSNTDAEYKAGAIDVLQKSSLLNDSTLIDISPGAIGNNPLGSDSGTGHATNPVTGIPYSADLVQRGDFGRSIAEYWADGPNSETPPGHWHVLANEVADHPATVKKVGGIGAAVSDLEWDVKMYFALAGAVHDAACAAWSLKRYYSGQRPITMIRYMGTMGQSSDAGAPSYNPMGLPLEPGVVEVITAESTAPGQRHEQIWNVYTNSYKPGTNFLGKIAVYSFPGEGRTNPPAQSPPVPATTQNTVRWMLAKDWLPFQRKTFNTPAFPGYVSGHSCFSRAAAEVLTLMTGSPYFPGGFHHHAIPKNSLQIDLGPSGDVDLQWCSYYDAADQAGQSRRWGGIHPVEDDFPARLIGAEVGKAAYALAEKYWTGTIAGEDMNLRVAIRDTGSPQLTWTAIRGERYKIQTSEDLLHWTDATAFTLSYSNGAITGDQSGGWTDPKPLSEKRFYRIVRSMAP